MPQDRRCCWTPAEAEEGVPSEGMQALRFWLRCLANSSLVCDSSYAQEFARVQLVPPQQRECCACIAAADPQLLNQHGDVEPGRAALLNLSHQHQLLAVWHGGPDPASLVKAHLNARDVCDLQAGANCSRALALDQGSAGSPARLSVLTRVAGDCSSAAPRRHAVSLLSWSGRRGVPVPLC